MSTDNMLGDPHSWLRRGQAVSDQAERQDPLGVLWVGRKRRSNTLLPPGWRPGLCSNIVVLESRGAEVVGEGSGGAEVVGLGRGRGSV